MRLYGPLVLSWCRRAGVEAADAEDIMQDVFAAVARGLSNFRRDRQGDSFHAWLAVITRNKLRDHARRKQKLFQAAGGTDHLERLAQAADELATATFDSGDGDSERRQVIRRASELVRAEFEPKTWEAFYLSTVEGLPVHVVSERLGATDNVVYKARYRVLRRLREELDGLL